MRIRRILPAFGVALLSGLASMLTACAEEQPERLVVLAAASLQGALEEVADDWSETGGTAPSLSYAATPAVARQVAEGAPADIVVTADSEWMDWLAERGLIGGLPQIVATNALVVVAPRGGDAPMSLEEFAADPDGGLIALAETDNVPAGRFAREALERLGLWDALEARVVEGENVRAALALAERGEVRLAIVYASDAQAARRVQVVKRLDPALHRPIVYYAAITARSGRDDAAEFLDFLTSDQGRARIASHGFGWL